MIYLMQLDGKVPPGIYGEHLRASGAPHRLLRLDAGASLPALAPGDGCIVFGGYMGVHDEADYPYLRPLKAFLGEAVEAGLPVLGICLGGQLLAAALGGTVSAGCRGEKGVCTLDLTPEGAADPLFAGLPSPFAAFEWHNDSFTVPPQALHLAASAACPGQAFRWRNAWGLQFHPEVDRQIVGAWSAPLDPQGRFAADFAAAEAAHRAMAQQLLENFLGQVSVVSAP